MAAKKKASPKRKPCGHGGARSGAGRPRLAEADQAILEVTLRLIERRGYSGLSIEQVAAAAGVARSTLYRRWPSKAALVQDAVEPILQTMATVPDSGNLRQDLLELLETTRSLLSGRPGRILQILIYESAQLPELKEAVEQEMQRRRRIYYQILGRAVSRGELRSEVDPELVCDLLLGPFLGRQLTARAQLPPEYVPYIVDTVLRGIAIPPTSGPLNASR